jgi:hypothetical protein
MSNTGAEQFSYGSFKQVYDSNPSIQRMIKNFDQEKITLDTQEQEETGLAPQKDDGNSSVGQMAKRATKARR